MTTIGGLPAHILLAHAVVVLVPLAGLGGGAAARPPRSGYEAVVNGQDTDAVEG